LKLQKLFENEDEKYALAVAVGLTVDEIDWEQ